MSSPTQAAQAPAGKRCQHRLRKHVKTVAVGSLTAAILFLGFRASLQASVFEQTDIGGPTLHTLGQPHASVPKSTANARLQKLWTASHAGSGIASLVSIFSLDFLPPPAGSNQPEAVKQRIAPVAQLELSGSEAPAAKPAEAAAEATPAPVATTAGAAAPAAGNAIDEANALVERWARAWSERDVDQYLGAYGKEFKPESGQSRSAWEQSRRQKIEGRKSISVTVRDLKIDRDGDDRLDVRFLQDYSSGNFHETGTPKHLTLAHEGGAWRIVAEASAPAGGK